MSEKVAKLEKEIKTMIISPLNAAEVNTNHPPDNFKCDQCDYFCKKEVTLKKHMNTKHQVEPEDLDIVVKNITNEKDLKEANRRIKEFEAQVEDLNLSKAKAECEARRSKLEAETMQSLLSLRQDDSVLLSKPKPKGKMK